MIIYFNRNGANTDIPKNQSEGSFIWGQKPLSETRNKHFNNRILLISIERAITDEMDKWDDFGIYNGDYEYYKGSLDLIFQRLIANQGIQSYNIYSVDHRIEIGIRPSASIENITLSLDFSDNFSWTQ